MSGKNDREKFTDAQKMCARYWGVESGEANDFALFAKALRAVKLSKAAVSDLRDWLPIHATGHIGDKIKAIDSLLGRME